MAAPQDEVNWTDDKIRWPEMDSVKADASDDDDVHVMDPFKDPNPTKTFLYDFCVGNKSIQVELKGYKYESDAVWKSTGLTLWKASEHLCNYLAHNSQLLQNKRVIEV
jgi:hypothetical protein